MLRIAAASVALVVLTGFTEADLLKKLDGQWQATSDSWTTAAAFEFVAKDRYIKAMVGSELYSGAIEALAITGESAVVKFGKTPFLVYPGSDAETVEVSIDGKPTLTFRHVTRER
ncbi:hypothetical protein [Mesorhizobium sp. 2RAF21]|uniref:hypothetical protein n=1 Tax=Mesorhizobium sp. 2RAF21 TaxID=3232995 RepID=UPI003F9A0AF3